MLAYETYSELIVGFRFGTDDNLSYVLPNFDLEVNAFLSTDIFVENTRDLFLLKNLCPTRIENQPHLTKSGESLTLEKGSYCACTRCEDSLWRLWAHTS